MKDKQKLVYLFVIILLGSSIAGYAAPTTESGYKKATARLALQAKLKEGQTAFYYQKYADAEKYFEDASLQAKAIDDKQLYAFSNGYLGFAKVYLDKLDEAELILKQSEQDATDSHSPVAKTLTEMAEIELYARRGDMTGQQKYIKAILAEPQSAFQALAISKDLFRQSYRNTQLIEKMVAVLSVPAQADDYFEDILLKGKVLHWNNDNPAIKVYLSSGEHYLGWRPEYIENFKKACSVWEQALNNKIQFKFVSKASDADVMVSWLPYKNFKAGGTDYSIYENHLANADIIFFLIDASNQFYGENEMYKLSLHELGHMLGIAGHSKNPNDIMFPSMTQTIKLSARDIATIRKLYAQSAQITNPTGITLSQYRQDLLTNGKHPYHIPSLD